jgi:MFS family permease
LFTAASISGGLAVEPGLLIASRVVQGIGAAMLAPAGLSLLSLLVLAVARAGDTLQATQPALLGVAAIVLLAAFVVRERRARVATHGSAGHRTGVAMLVAAGFALAGLLATRVVPAGPPHPHRPQSHHLFQHHAGGIP